MDKAMIRVTKPCTITNDPPPGVQPIYLRSNEPIRASPRTEATAEDHRAFGWKTWDKMWKQEDRLKVPQKGGAERSSHEKREEDTPSRWAWHNTERAGTQKGKGNKNTKPQKGKSFEGVNGVSEKIPLVA